MYSTEERERIANALESENPASLLKLYRIVLGEGEKNNTHKLFVKLADLIRHVEHPDATADCGGWHVDVHDPCEVLDSPSQTAQEVAGMMASVKYKCCDCRYFAGDTDTLTMGVCFMGFNGETTGHGYSFEYRPACEKFDKRGE